jgi:hypothetical protein
MSDARQYRKKPVVIEAMELTGANAMRLAATWAGGKYRYEQKPSDPSDVAYWVDIPTLEGVMKANQGDFIIKGVQGEFYPCKPEIFAATYEAVEAPHE